MRCFCEVGEKDCQRLYPADGYELGLVLHDDRDGKRLAVGYFRWHLASGVYIRQYLAASEKRTDKADLVFAQRHGVAASFFDNSDSQCPAGLRLFY